MGLATVAINRLGMEAGKIKAMLDGIPVVFGFLVQVLLQTAGVSGGETAL